MPFSTDVKDPSDFSQYDTAAISETDRAHFLHPWQIFDAIAEEGALPIAAAEGAYIYDTDGNRYLDAVGGLWCTNIGLGRNEMADAIADLLDILTSRVRLRSVLNAELDDVANEFQSKLLFFLFACLE